MLRWFRRRSTRLPPEARWLVVVDADGLGVTDLAGVGVPVPVAELSAVAIQTTDQGPFATDVWWLLFGAEGRALCRFPLGATGMDAALDRLGQLPGFDHAAMALAMGSTGNAAFPLWQREDAFDGGG